MPHGHLSYAYKNSKGKTPQTGSIISDAIMDPETLGKGVKMFAQVTLKPGCAVPIRSACRQQ
mgnify:CR=1 FL=1